MQTLTETPQGLVPAAEMNTAIAPSTAPAQGVGDSQPASAPISRQGGVDRVWGAMLGRSFTAISNYFLANAHRIGPAGSRGLTPTEVLVIIHILSFKWGSAAPYPALGTIGERMGLSTRTVRDTVKRLEALGLVKRELNTNGGSSRYHFDGLFQTLEAMMAADQAKKDQDELEKAA